MMSLFLHVGYPKTGTSSLQRNLFGGHSQIFSLRSQIDNLSQVRKAICRGPNAQLAHYRASLAPVIGSAPVETAVFSEEGFTSNFANAADEGVNAGDVARRLATVFPPDDYDTRVLLTIRKQQDILKSAYTFWYHLYEEMGYETLDALVAAGVEGSEPARGILAWFRYANTVNAYVEAFGKDRVSVLLYERFDTEPRSFLTDLSHRLGVDVNEALRLMNERLTYNASRTGDTYYQPTRIYHVLSSLKSTYLPNAPSIRRTWLGKKLVQFLKEGRGREIDYSADSLRRLRSFYQASNRRLVEAYDLPLREWDYFT